MFYENAVKVYHGFDQSGLQEMVNTGHAFDLVAGFDVFNIIQEMVVNHPKVKTWHIVPQVFLDTELNNGTVIALHK